MSSQHIKVMVPPATVVPRMAAWIGRAAASWIAWWRNEPRTADELRALAFEVEAQQPSLAADLRRMALYEEAAQEGRGCA